MVSAIQQILNEYPHELKKSMSKKDIVVVKAKDKSAAQKEIESKLTKKNIPYYREKNQALSGSTETTVIPSDTKNTVLVFKPASGGMAETTLNSTITELSPALAFEGGLQPKSVQEFYSFLKTVDHKKSKVYVVTRDIEAGRNFVNDFPKSSKFEDKMQNAMGVLKYLNEENKKRKIKNVYWGYRAKPTYKNKQIDSSHKGDLFIEYDNGSMIGLSLKAGDEQSKEPKLNTYVNPILENLDNTKVNELRGELWERVYSLFGTKELTYDKQDKKETLKKLSNLENVDIKQYDKFYDIGLEIIRKTLISAFSEDVKKTVNYLRKAIVGDEGDVPLVVLKAYGTNYKILTDEDDVSAFLPKVTKVNCYASTTSKQDFYIELVGSNMNEKLKLKFAVRTNKTGDEHKLGQFFNLAVKFNGIE